MKIIKAIFFGWVAVMLIATTTINSAELDSTALEFKAECIKIGAVYEKDTGDCDISYIPFDESIAELYELSMD